MQHIGSIAMPSAARPNYSPPRSAASYERELERYRAAERDLRRTLAAYEQRLRQKDEAIQNHGLMSSESNHRILNDLQMIVSLLSLQSRATDNAEAASQLTAAADRIVAMARMHRRLHSFDGAATFAFKRFLMDLGSDFAAMLSLGDGGEREIIVEGEEIELPAATCRALGFIANELITNAVKYGTGRITVRLERNPEKGYALSISNEGSAIPAGFNPSAGKGLGMRIVEAFVQRIGGEFRIAGDENSQGPRFTVLFS